MTIITTTHKITPKITIALVSASGFHGVFGGSNPDTKEAIVFVILDFDTLVVTRIMPEGAIKLSDGPCKKLFDEVMAKVGLVGTE